MGRDRKKKTIEKIQKTSKELKKTEVEKCVYQISLNGTLSGSNTNESR